MELVSTVSTSLTHRRERGLHVIAEGSPGLHSPSWGGETSVGRSRADAVSTPCSYASHIFLLA